MALPEDMRCVACCNIVVNDSIGKLTNHRWLLDETLKTTHWTNIEGVAVCGKVIV